MIIVNNRAIQDKFKKFEDEPLYDRSTIDNFLLGLSYLNGYGYLKGLDAQYDAIYIKTHSLDTLDDVDARHLVKLGFDINSYGLIFYV